MEIFVLVHEIYSYEDHDTEINTELFKTYEDAKIYFELLKVNVIDEYERRTNEPLRVLEQWDEFYSYENYYDLPGDTTKMIFNMSLDEYGHDFITIKKKTVMSFMEA